VVPRHPPSTLEQITKYMFVPNALPGPIMLSRLPGLPVAESARESLSTVYLMAAWRCFLERRFQGASGAQVTSAGRRYGQVDRYRTLARFSLLIRPDARTGSIESSSKWIFPSWTSRVRTPSPAP
jgi:hypothetical protein